MQLLRSDDNARLVLRSLFISDLHLGSVASKSAAFLDFLRNVEVERIFLVGDIFELWSGARLHWSDTQAAVLAELEARRAAGVEVVYLPGNHDLEHQSAAFAARHGFAQQRDHLYETVSGQRYLVLHGDLFDMAVLRSPAMTSFGARTDGLLHAMDALVTRLCGVPVRLGAWMVRRFHMLVLTGNRHERRLTRHARAQGCHGVICGHFHLARIRARDGVTYANCGDWVHSLTALAEAPDGALQLMRWRPGPRTVEVVAVA